MLHTNINIAAELQRHAIDYTSLAENEIACQCPFHADTSPSLHINIQQGTFICRASQCGETGDFVAFLARKLGLTRSLVTQDLSTRYVLSDEPTVDAQVVEKYHSKIWAAHNLLAELRKRGIRDADIRKYRLGEHRGRVTIPIMNESHMFVNIRSYLPGAPGADKMKNLKGRAKLLRFFPQDQLAYKKIVICGGEMKAIVTARVLNQYGYGAVCVTGGEGFWQPYLTPKLLGKDIWVLFDVDEAGKVGSDTVCKHLIRTAATLHIVHLPLDIDIYPKGDVNDYVNDFVDQGKGDLLKVVEGAPDWTAAKQSKYDDDEPVNEISLTQSAHASYTGKRVSIVATVSTLDTSPYVLPKDVEVQCSRDQEFCALCAVSFNDPTYLYRIHPESSALLEMLGQRKTAQVAALKDELQIPEACRVCKFEPKTYWNVEDARLSPQLDITNNTAERTMMPAICVGDKLELNESYKMTGRMHPHPMTQQSTLVISNYEATHDALSNYVLDDTKRLDIFQPSEWTLEAVADKLKSIYDDFETNVTQIYQRQHLHTIIDLAYHSSLLVQLDDKLVKGWVEVLIVGDSAQGKSETAINMQQHYGLGEKVECKNATVAGLLGGLQQMGSRWFVSWGVWPTHDRRLLILEELKGASTDVIGKLTDMRSSGFAELPKIERRRTWARARVVALSNTRSNMSLERYNYGVNAIVELIGALEDVRRFDAAMIVEKSEVNSIAINELQMNRAKVEHVYTSELCRELVLWCWTRTHALFTDRARSRTLEVAKQMCEEFSDTIPIVDRGSMRYKIARLAAAVAGRTFSCTNAKDSVLVRQCHVEWVHTFLRDIYGTKAMGYREFTASERASNTLSDADDIMRRLCEVPYPADFVQSLIHAAFIEIRDIMDWCQWAADDCNRLVSFLVRKRAFKRIGRAYVKTPAFIQLLKERHDQVKDRPKHVEDY